MELIEKAWMINAVNWDTPWFVPNDCFYGNDKNKVKLEVLKYIRYDGYVDKHDNDFTYLTIKIKRAKNADKYLIDGEIKTKSDIDYDNHKKERDLKLDELLKNNPNGKAYILKGGYYYRPNHCGYTERTVDAGIYPLKEAISVVKSCSLADCMNVVLIDNEVHNSELLNKIKELESKLI